MTREMSYIVSYVFVKADLSDAPRTKDIAVIALITSIVCTAA